MDCQPRCGGSGRWRKRLVTVAFHQSNSDSVPGFKLHRNAFPASSIFPSLEDRKMQMWAARKSRVARQRNPVSGSHPVAEFDPAAVLLQVSVVGERVVVVTDQNVIRA